MDTSEQYIKMCDCPEIQKEWLMSEENNFVLDKPNGKIWSIPKTGYRAHGAVWLPRQDQLQEMIQDPKASAYFTLHIFYEWINEHCIYDNSLYKTWIGNVSNSSMEQLWLAFVMDELYGKRWDGDKWTIRVIDGGKDERQENN